MKPFSQNFTTNLIRTGMRYGRCSIFTTAFSSEILKWTISSLKLLSSSSLSKFSLGVINIVCWQVGAVKIDTHTYTHTHTQLSINFSICAVDKLLKYHVPTLLSKILNLDTFWRDYSTTNNSFMLLFSLGGYKSPWQKTSLKMMQQTIGWQNESVALFH